VHRRNKSILVGIILLSIIIGFSHSPWIQGKAMAAAAPETTAVSAILMDENGTILFEKDPHKRLPPASVTKVMTLLLAIEALEQGRIQLADEVITSEHAWRQGGS